MNPIARSPKQVGQALQNARRRLGLSQTGLAERAGLRQELVSRIESGHAGARIGSICDLLAALDLELTIGPRTRSSSADIEDIF